MAQNILIWLFVGTYIGQLASQYLEGRRWHGHNGDLAIGVVGSLLGGAAWTWHGQPEALLGALLYSIIGSLAILLLLRLVGHKQPGQRTPNYFATFDGEF